MTFAQLRAVLVKGGIKTLGDVKDLKVLEALQAEILSGKLGLQEDEAPDDLVVPDPRGVNVVKLERLFGAVVVLDDSLHMVPL